MAAWDRTSLRGIFQKLIMYSFFTTHIVLRPSVLACGGVHLEISRSCRDPEPVATFDWSSSADRSLAFGAIRLGRPDFHSNANQQQI
jgi:hypothetical protein